MHIAYKEHEEIAPERVEDSDDLSELLKVHNKLAELRYTTDGKASPEKLEELLDQREKLLEIPFVVEVMADLTGKESNRPGGLADEHSSYPQYQHEKVDFELTLTPDLPKTKQLVSDLRANFFNGL